MTYFAASSYPDVMAAAPKSMCPIFSLAASSSAPAFAWTSLSTPEPITGLGFAVFTTASTSIFTRLFLTISKGIIDFLLNHVTLPSLLYPQSLL